MIYVHVKQPILNSSKRLTGYKDIRWNSHLFHSSRNYVSVSSQCSSANNPCLLRLQLCQICLLTWIMLTHIAPPRFLLYTINVRHFYKNSLNTIIVIIHSRHSITFSITPELRKYYVNVLVTSQPQL
jgi:hypothetical protein